MGKRPAGSTVTCLAAIGPSAGRLMGGNRRVTPFFGTPRRPEAHEGGGFAPGTVTAAAGDEAAGFCGTLEKSSAVSQHLAGGTTCPGTSFCWSIMAATTAFT